MKVVIYTLIVFLSIKLHCQTDTIRTYYPDTVLKSKAYIKKNRIYETVYFHSGILKSEMIMKKDSIPIFFKAYTEDGKILFDQKNKKEVISYNWEFGTVSYIRMKKGQPHGKSKTFENGKLSSIMIYNHGVIEGKSTGYDLETGDVIMEENYIDGKLNGEGVYYNRGHILSRKIYYENDCPIKAQSFNKEGEMTYETTDLKEINWRYRSTEYCK